MKEGVGTNGANTRTSTLILVPGLVFMFAWVMAFIGRIRRLQMFNQRSFASRYNRRAPTYRVT